MAKLDNHHQSTKQPPMPDLLSELAAQAYEQPILTDDERVHKLWEDMVKRLDRSQLKVACINYTIICKQISSSLNQTA